MRIQFVNSTVDFVIYIANYLAISHTWAGKRAGETRQCAGSIL